MNNKLIKLLASICLGLCLIIVSEWLYAKYTRRNLLTSISAVKTQDYKQDQLPEIALTKQPEEAYVDLVARPLFIKGRRPVEEPSPEVEQAAAKSESFDWQLSGIYITPTNRSALLSRAKTKVVKDNYRRKTIGEDIDGWKLTEILQDKVILKLGNTEKELPLRKPKPKGLAQQINTAIPPIPSPFSIPVPVPAPPIPAPPPAIPEPGVEPAVNFTEEPSEGNQ